VRPSVLVYGYGNPGRLDDGLGPALAGALLGHDLGGEVTVETGYQLQVEDAALVAEHAGAVFADADAACAPPFELRRLSPRREAAFTTHSVAPEAVLALAREHFGGQTVGFALGIRGYEFDDYGERLSAAAQGNLAAASEFVLRALRDGSLAGHAVRAERGGDVHVRA
jgi:hydrogenase maturation protease